MDLRVKQMIQIPVPFVWGLIEIHQSNSVETCLFRVCMASACDHLKTKEGNQI